MAFLIAIDVVVRKLFATTLMSGGVGEISGYVLAIITAWGAASALLARSHVRIDTLQIMLPRPAGRLADMVAVVAFFAASAVLSYVAYFTFNRSLMLDAHSMTPLAVPLAIPQGLWFAGLAFLTLMSAAIALAGCVALIRRDYAAAHRLIGPRSVEEEVDEQNAIIESSLTEAKP
ncbi:TRAP transporter small permease subunit [Mesorhizobium sp. CN5-321]|jgi:TRAP-type C4-dicarboxylate transport system permease small subunit|uniref:TRAP transporter small permease subunit n=1 Tax=Mesorhizobium hunchu TaxID=3157708 RepID=UPI0032B6F9B9